MENIQNEQKQLFDTALNDSWHSMRMKAAQKLTDEKLIIRLYKEKQKSDLEMLNILLEKITDQSILAEFARDANDWLHTETLEKITDRSILTDIAQNAEAVEVRVAAAKKLSDKSLAQEIFMGIAKNSAYWGDRHRAVPEITDQAFLFSIIENDENIYVRRSAVKALTDKDLLQKIIDGGKEKYSETHTDYLAVDEAARGADYIPPSKTHDLRDEARKRLAELENK
jgi:ribosomal protein L17